MDDAFAIGRSSASATSMAISSGRYIGRDAADQVIQCVPSSSSMAMNGWPSCWLISSIVQMF